MNTSGTMVSLSMLLLLLSSLVGSVFPLSGPAMDAPIPIDLAGHQGERTAQYLAVDTDLYFAVNLDPYEDQADLFQAMVNAWRLNPNVQAKWAELLGEAESESGISLQDDVFPWLGPEVALGMRNVVPGPDYAVGPNSELYQAQAAAAACMAEAGVAQLDAGATGWSGGPGQVTCTVVSGDADEGNLELSQALTAIEACKSLAGTDNVDSAVPAWDGSNDAVTATSSENWTFDAADFLSVTVPFGATYEVSSSGDIIGGTPVSWQDVIWDDIANQWINTGETTFDAASYLYMTPFKATYDVDVNGNIVQGQNVSWPNVVWVAGSWQSTVPRVLPEEVLLIGTINKTASDAFFEKLKQWIIENELSEYQSGWYYSKYWVEFVEMSYRSCRLVKEVHHQEYEYYEPYQSVARVVSTQFYGFTSEYTVTSSSQSAVERTIDLILDGGLSLADDADFKAAQSALPAQRMGMFFIDLDNIKDEICPHVPQELEALAGAGLSFFPPYYAGSMHLTEGGIEFRATYPLPEEGYVTTSGPNLLKTASLVPSNAWAFHSGQDIEASWSVLRTAMAENWSSLTETIFAEGPPPGMTEADIATFDNLVAWINSSYGVDLEADLAGWMTGEWCVAMMPPVMDAEGQIESVDTLAIFEVADPAAVQASFENLADVMTQMMGQGELGHVQAAVTYMMQDNGLTAIEGVQTATNNMSAFPDTTTLHGTAGVGWNLYQCDVNGDGVFEPYSGPYPYDRRYIWEQHTIWSYTCDNAGTVHQVGGPDLALDTATIGGLEASFIDAEMWQAFLHYSQTPPAPGWLFLDYDGRHYLVIGSSEPVLEAAVNASRGNIASLDEATTYQALLSLLPDTKMSMSYCDLAALANAAMQEASAEELRNVQAAVTWMMEDNGLATIQGVQVPTDNMSAFPDTTTLHGTAGAGWTLSECDVNGDGIFQPYSGPYPYDRYYFWQEETTWSYTCDNQGNVTQHSNENADLFMGLIPLKAALGLTYALGPNDTAVLIAVLYIQPPPLMQQSIPPGTSTVNIPERVFDLSHLNASVGKCAVSLSVAVLDAPEGASIVTTALDKIPEDVMSAFRLAAADGTADILDIAYGMRVDLTNLSEANVGTATITMKVGRVWADTYGVENVKVFRLSGSTREVLPTTFVGYDGDYAIFEATSLGLSTFGLAALAAKPEALTVSALSITPSEIKVGQSATISVTVVNSSIASGGYAVVLKIDGTTIETRNITLDADSSQVVTFTVPRDAEGTYTIDVNGLTGELRVVAAGGKTNWALIGGLIGGGVLVFGGVGVWLLARRRQMPA